MFRLSNSLDAKPLIFKACLHFPKVLEFREDHFKGLYDYVSTILKMWKLGSFLGVRVLKFEFYAKSQNKSFFWCNFTHFKSVTGNRLSYSPPLLYNHSMIPGHFGHSPKWTLAKMDICQNGHSPKWTYPGCRTFWTLWSLFQNDLNCNLGYNIGYFVVEKDYP